MFRLSLPARLTYKPSFAPRPRGRRSQPSASPAAAIIESLEERVLLAGDPLVPDATEDAKDQLAATFQQKLTEAFNRADSNLVPNVTGSVGQIIQGLRTELEGTKTLQGLPAWTPESFTDGFRDTVTAAESQVYGLEDIFKPSLDGFTLPFVSMYVGGWGLMGPVYMQGYIFNGENHFPDGAVATYQFVQEMDGRQRGTFGYTFPTYLGGGSILARHWTASKALDGTLQVTYTNKLSATDSVTGEKTTQSLTFDWTQPGATPQPETFNATYELMSPKKYIKSAFTVANGTSSGNVQLEYADATKYFTGAANVFQDRIDFDVDAQFLLNTHASAGVWAQRINGSSAGSAHVTFASDELGYLTGQYGTAPGTDFLLFRYVLRQDPYSVWVTDGFKEVKGQQPITFAPIAGTGTPEGDGPLLGVGLTVAESDDFWDGVSDGLTKPKSKVRVGTMIQDRPDGINYYFGFAIEARH